MAHLARLGATSAKLQSLYKKQKELRKDLERSLKRGNDEEIRRIQKELTAISQQITEAEADTRLAADSIPKRF